MEQKKKHQYKLLKNSELRDEWNGRRFSFFKSATLEELMQIKGIGKVKSNTIKSNM